MIESNSRQAAVPAYADRHKTLVVILTIVTTVITTIVAGLQADAGIRASINNRDSQVYAILAAGEIQRQSLQTAYDMKVFADYVLDSQEATLLLLTTLQLEQDGNTQGADSTQLASDIAQARADMAQKFSVFYTDPRYAPETEDGIPDMQTYTTDSFVAANDLVAQQNASADEYNRWNRKSDSYAGVLAIMAIVFFLFGMAQALSPRLRLLFAIFGLVTLAAAGLWTLLVLVS